MSMGPMDFKRITPEDFLRLNPGNDETLEELREAAKHEGTCDNCGQPIWKLGSLLVGWDGCFSCITGEADASDDYELA